VTSLNNRQALSCENKTDKNVNTVNLKFQTVKKSFVHHVLTTSRHKIRQESVKALLGGQLPVMTARVLLKGPKTVLDLAHFNLL
jgi:hypothetical protein